VRCGLGRVRFEPLTSWIDARHISRAGLWRRFASVVAATLVLSCGGGSETGNGTPQANSTMILPAVTEAPVASATSAPTETAVPTPTAAPTETVEPLPSPTTKPTSAPTSPASAEPTPVPQSSGGGTAALAVHATNFSFSPGTLTVTTGALVTIHFVNDDQSIPHNIAFDLAEPQSTTPCPGPCTADLTFDAPAPGEYVFNCSVHPYMTGTLRVQ